MYTAYLARLQCVYYSLYIGFCLDILGGWGGDMHDNLTRADPSDHYWRDWSLFSWLLRQRILCGLINRDSW